MLTSKWLFICVLFSILVLNSIHAMPTPTSMVKRQDVIEEHRQPVSRSTTEEPTETGKPGKDDHKDDNKNVDKNQDKDDKNNNSNNSGNQASPEIKEYKSTEWYVAVYGTESGISPQMASLGAILIVLGLFLCSMGFRMFRPMLCVMGLLTFGSMTWIALANLKPSGGYPRDDILMIVVPAGVGLVGAGIFYFVWNIALYLVSAFGGFIFAIFVLSWRGDLVIVHLIGRSCFLGGMALAAGAATFFALRPMLFFATSFVGAYIFMFGIDCLSRSGFIAGPQAILNRNRYNLVEYELNKFVYVMLAMIIVMFLISMAWQMLFNAAHHLGMHIVAAAKGKPAHEEAKEEPADGRPPSTAPTS